jgi:hypothetical protein
MTTVDQITNNRRLIAIWPRTLRELEEMIVNRTRGVLWPPTQANIADDEPVLLDVRVPGTDSHIVLRAKGRYTIPERRGPMFVCHRDDQLQFAAILRAIETPLQNARVFPRYPAGLEAKVTMHGVAEPLSARVTDVSAAGARLEIEGDLVTGAEVLVEVAQPDSHALPRSWTGRVLGGRRGGVAMHFGGPDFDAWKQVRYALRRAGETGVAPSLGV